MKPLNTAERKSAFIYFLIFFAVTTGIIVLTVLFGMRVPFKENERMQQQIAALQKEKAFAETFSTKMTDTKILLDSVNRAGIQAELINGKISQNLNEMNAMIEKDSAGIKKFYRDIVNNLLDLQDAKKQLRDASNKDVDLSQYLQQIEILKSDLNRSRMEADALRLQLLSMSR